MLKSDCNSTTGVIMCTWRLTAILLAVCVAVPANAQPTDRAFTQRLHRVGVELALPGFSAAVVHNGKIVYRHLEGVVDRASGLPVTKNSLFGIASITKSMTGIILSQLEAEGK